MLGKHVARRAVSKKLLLSTLKLPQIRFVAKAIHHTLEFGSFRILVAKNSRTLKEHVVLIKGHPEGKENVLCRIASECLPGTALHSADCDCKEQLDLSLKIIARRKQGVVIYLRQEGRGQGLENKIKGLANKNKGYDTFTAIEALGLKADIRKYGEASEIIRMLKLKSIALITNNPDKAKDLADHGINIRRLVSAEVPPNRITHRHLVAKKQRGHNLVMV